MSGVIPAPTSAGMGHVRGIMTGTWTHTCIPSGLHLPMANTTLRITAMGSSSALGHTVFGLVIWQVVHPLT
jgi:hypothetical protein